MTRLTREARTYACTAVTLFVLGILLYWLAWRAASTPLVPEWLALGIATLALVSTVAGFVSMLLVGTVRRWQ